MYFPCIYASVSVLCKSIFVCFATSLDILFGATDREAVKCDLNILCLHLFPPFSLLSLPFDFSPLPSAVNNIIGSKRVPGAFDGSPTHPARLSPYRRRRTVCSRHKAIKPFVLACLGLMFVGTRSCFSLCNVPYVVHYACIVLHC